MMWTLLNPRMYLALAAAAILAVSHVTAYRSGQGSIRTKWEADITARAVETAKTQAEYRAKEQALQTKVQKVTVDYDNAKKSNVAMAHRLSDELRNFQGILGGSTSEDPAATTRDHGATPELKLLGTCAAALAELAEITDGLSLKSVALQAYINSVLVK